MIARERFRLQRYVAYILVEWCSNGDSVSDLSASSFSDLKRNQRARFATLLLYLNEEGLEGGETSFPRWVNAETFHPLKVKPRAGQAVLFYSQLPDGNFDDFSQHAALKPTAGEKWLINL